MLSGGAAERRQALFLSSPRHHHRLSTVDCRCGRLLNTGNGERVGAEVEARPA